MFLIYINDLAELLTGFNITIKLFADDVKLYVKVIGPVDESELLNYRMHFLPLSHGLTVGSCLYL